MRFDRLVAVLSLLLALAVAQSAPKLSLKNPGFRFHLYVLSDNDERPARLILHHLGYIPLCQSLCAGAGGVSSTGKSNRRTVRHVEFYTHILLVSERLEVKVGVEAQNEAILPPVALTHRHIGKCCAGTLSPLSAKCTSSKEVREIWDKGLGRCRV